MSKLVHMKRSKQEKKDSAPQVAGPEGDDYPYGLRLRLDHDSMSKLGMEDMPKVGKKMHVHGKGVVTSVSSHDSGNHKDRHVEIQLHHMGVENDEPSIKDTLKSRYDAIKGEKGKK